MAGRVLQQGDTVRTPDGGAGRILKRSKRPFLVSLAHTRYDLDGEGDVIVYAVLLETGEVRQYSFDALARANNPTQ